MKPGVLTPSIAPSIFWTAVHIESREWRWWYLSGGIFLSLYLRCGVCICVSLCLSRYMHVCVSLWRERERFIYSKELTLVIVEAGKPKIWRECW